MAKKNANCAPIVAILLVATLCVLGCIIYSKAQDAKALNESSAVPPAAFTDWMYYDDFSAALENGEVDISYSITPETLTYTNIAEATPETTSIAEEVKNRLRERFGAYTSLNWARFEAAVVKECDFPASYYGVEASYDAATNTMYCIRNMTFNQDENLLRLILAHEYIHALSSAASNNNSRLSEGEVEYFAHKAYDCDDIAYQLAYAFAEAYAIKHGEEKAISALVNDSLADEIDRDLGRNAMQNIDILLLDTSSANKRVALDVYFHYVNGISDRSVQETATRLLDELDNMYENRQAKAYYQSILQ